MDKLLRTIDELKIYGTNNEEARFEIFKEETKRLIKSMRKEIQNKMLELHEHHKNSFKHNVMVAHDVKYIAESLALPKDDVESLFIAGLLHDIGKLDIMDILHTVSIDEEQKMLEMKRKENPNDMKLMREGIRPVEALTIFDFLRYKKQMHSDFNIDMYYVYLKKRRIPLTWTLRRYLDYHQERTREILKRLNLDPKIVEFAASHHPEYFTDEIKVNWKCYIIEIADKFNAITHSEGMRPFARKYNRILALDMVIDTLKKRYADSIFKRGRRKIVRALGKKYIPFEIHHSILPIGENIIDSYRKYGKLNEDELKTIETLIANIETTFQVNKNVSYILDDHIIAQLLNLESKLKNLLKAA